MVTPFVCGVRCDESLMKILSRLLPEETSGISYRSQNLQTRMENLREFKHNKSLEVIFITQKKKKS